MTPRLLLLPGDGIGPEVTDAAVAALDAVGRRFGHRFQVQSCPIGGAALRAGDAPLPAATRDAALGSDAVFLGAVGDPAFDDRPPRERPEAGILELRRVLATYANIRPGRVWPGLDAAAPLKPALLGDVDLVVIRELTGGLYFGEPRGRDADSAWNTLRYSRPEIARIARIAFDLAGGRRRLVTSVDKANVLETSQLWRAVVVEIAAGYPDVALEHMYVDACAMRLVADPAHFDVILTENMFGDILSDEVGAIVGSLGLLPSASLGDGPGLFEPVHGSAPDIAGRDLANPIGAIASAAMLLRHTLGAEAEAAAIERAIAEALAAGLRTADLSPGPEDRRVGCARMGREIAERILDR